MMKGRIWLAHRRARLKSVPLMPPAAEGTSSVQVQMFVSNLAVAPFKQSNLLNSCCSRDCLCNTSAKKHAHLGTSGAIQWKHVTSYIICVNPSQEVAWLWGGTEMQSRQYQRSQKCKRFEFVVGMKWRSGDVDVIKMQLMHLSSSFTPSLWSSPPYFI